jgi:methylthioribose-1-phosphate isomerase
MRIHGKHYRTIWPVEAGTAVEIIDQRLLPFELAIRRLSSVDDAAEAIRTMQVRGAPLIGATAAYGLALAMQRDSSDASLVAACAQLEATRPTAVNLHWALASLRSVLAPLEPRARGDAALARAAAICDEDVAQCRAIGEHGVAFVCRAAAERPGRPVNVLTHCNAGWLATVDYGTALSPVYRAYDSGIAVHVWVDETRPRNQGASLTAWELGEHGVPHTIIADNAGGHLMQEGLVDLCIVGTDRTARNGDVCNKIGTYLKALAARDNGVPFYAAVPQSSVDWSLAKGVGVIPIEERDAAEVHELRGRASDGRVLTVRVTPEKSVAKNWAFDVTPAHLVTALITERGVCEASEPGLRSLYPERGL